MRWKIYWNTLRMEGFFDTMSIIFIQKILALHEQRNASFDRRMNVDTMGMIDAKTQDFKGNNRDSAVYYWPTPIPTLKSIFSFLKELKLDFRKYVFIDLGCGKGKPLFFASSYPFKGIIGVEASVDTYEVVKKNILSYKNPRQKCFNIEAHNCDMLEYEFPADPLVIFLGNPFVPNSPLYNDLIHNLVNASRRAGPVYILYYCPDSIALFEAAAAVRKLTHYKSLFDSHDWAVFQIN